MGKHTKDVRGRHGLGWLAAVTVIGLGVGVLVGAGGARAFNTAPALTETVASTPSVSPEPDTTRTCSVNEVVSSASALDFHGMVTRADTGEVLLQRQQTSSTPTASVMKLVTAVTAITVLGADTRIPTRVYEGEAPGSVVLVGGGDVTLKSQQSSVYASAASMAELADQLAGREVTAVGVDDSLFSGEQWQSSWDEFDRIDGSTAPVSALMVDAGREDATVKFSPRSESPTADAAAVFAAQLGASVDTSVTVQPDSEPIAEVWSPSVQELVEVMLRDSDNVVAEALARLVAIEVGVGSDFAAVDAGAEQALVQLGVNAAGFYGADGSGLSRDNRATAVMMLDVLELIDADAHGLGMLRDALPENMVSGTLAERLSSVPAGAIAAKTGFTKQVYALAGLMELADGARLAFAVFVTVPDPSSDAVITSITNRDALDEAIAAIYRCGLNLRNG